MRGSSKLVRARHKNDSDKRIALVAVMIVTVALAALVILSPQKRSSDSFLPQVPVMGTQVPTVEAAGSIVGYKILVPTSVPSGLTLQSIRVVSQIHLVYLIYGASVIPSRTLVFSDLISNGFWILIESPQDPSVTPSQVVASVVADSNGQARATLINNNPGYIVDSGTLSNHIVWWVNGVRCELVTPTAAMPSQLEQVAGSTI
jgi:hypothetical protein